MRVETIAACIFVGLGLLMIGTLLYMFQITEGRFLAVLGIVYFGIGMVLTLTHDRHMAKRMQAGRE